MGGCGGGKGTTTGRGAGAGVWQDFIIEDLLASVLASTDYLGLRKPSLHFQRLGILRLGGYPAECQSSTADGAVARNRIRARELRFRVVWQAGMQTWLGVWTRGLELKGELTRLCCALFRGSGLRVQDFHGCKRGFDCTAVSM